MVLSRELRLKQLGLPVSILSKEVPGLLTAMIKQSLGDSMVNLEVVVSVTEETLEQQLEVSWLLKEVTT